jgi:hypothetical protein
MTLLSSVENRRMVASTIVPPFLTLISRSAAIELRLTRLEPRPLASGGQPDPRRVCEDRSPRRAHGSGPVRPHPGGAAQEFITRRHLENVEVCPGRMAATAEDARRGANLL